MHERSIGLLVAFAMDGHAEAKEMWQAARRLQHLMAMCTPRRGRTEEVFLCTECRSRKGSVGPSQSGDYTALRQSIGTEGLQLLNHDSSPKHIRLEMPGGSPNCTTPNGAPQPPRKGWHMCLFRKLHHGHALSFTEETVQCIATQTQDCDYVRVQRANTASS
jgi:hypothetical protein